MERNPYLSDANGIITMTLPWPPTVNTYWRNVRYGNRSRVLISKDGRDYRRNVLSMLKTKRRTITGRVAVHIAAHPPDRRQRDLDNINKSLLDAITHAGIIEDDSLIDDLHVVRRSVIKGGKVVVTCTEIQREDAA